MSARGPLNDGGPQLIALPGLDDVVGLAAALSTRKGGVSGPPFDALNLGRSVGDDPEAVVANRAAVAKALGFRMPRFARQVHGARVTRLQAQSGPAPQADALLLDRPGVLGGVLGADCTLSLLVEPQARVLVLLHAGWRGLAAKMAGAALSALLARPDTHISRVRAVLASGICCACYEVGADVVQALRRTLPFDATDPRCKALFPTGTTGREHADLRGVLQAQWRAAGVPDERQWLMPGCTREDAEQCFSHRRDGTRSGRHALLAGWQAV